jgi:hypothetical protein
VTATDRAALQVSAHLLLAELACKDGTPYPPEWIGLRAVPLSDEFEKVRAVIGKPIVIDSAYRTAAYNATCKGSAKNSQHIQGRALDMRPTGGVTVAQLYDVVRSVANDPASAIYGIGRYPTFVHMDIRPPRPDGKLTCWQGSRAWAEVKA